MLMVWYHLNGDSLVYISGATMVIRFECSLCYRLSWLHMILSELGKIALVQVIPPIATHFAVAWCVCLSSVTHVHPV